MSSKPTWVRGERLSELETLPTAQNLVSFKDYMHFIGPTSDEVSFCTEGKKKKKKNQPKRGRREQLIRGK